MLLAFFGLIVPRAIRHNAIALGLGVSPIHREGWDCEGQACEGWPRKGWACEDKREGQCKNRKKSFHGVYSLGADLKSGRYTAFAGVGSRVGFDGTARKSPVTHLME